MIRLYAKRWRVYLWWKVRAQACAAGCLLVENNWVCEIWTIIYSFRALLLTSLKKYRILSVQFSGNFWGFFFLGLKNDLSLPESILAPQTVKGGHFSSWSDHNRTTPSWPHTFFKKHTLIKKNYSTCVWQTWNIWAQKSNSGSTNALRPRSPTLSRPLYLKFRRSGNPSL